jgi:hypothetical protein
MQIKSASLSPIRAANTTLKVFALLVSKVTICQTELVNYQILFARLQAVTETALLVTPDTFYIKRFVSQ